MHQHFPLSYSKLGESPGDSRDFGESRDQACSYQAGISQGGLVQKRGFLWTEKGFFGPENGVLVQKMGVCPENFPGWVL